jgi:hypothetical protein
VLYGRRRCGKPRLLIEVLPAGRAVSYVANDRESPLQRVAVATELPRRRYFNRTWWPARPWWGPGTDRTPLEVDLVAESTDGAALLIGEVEWTQHPDPGRLHAEVRRKVKNLPFAHEREIVAGVWTSGRHRPGQSLRPGRHPARFAIASERYSDIGSDRKTGSAR